MPRTILPSSENIFSDNLNKTVYYYYDRDRKPVYKTKEVYKTQRLVILYPYSLNRLTGQVTPKRIKMIEFRGWDSFHLIPKDFKQSSGYGFTSKRIKSFFSLIYPKFKELEKVVFGINIQTRFSKKTISLNWGDLELILKKISREIAASDNDRKSLITNQLSAITAKFIPVNRKLTAGDLQEYLSKFDSFDKITTKDAESLAKVFDKLPSGKIITTSHFIKTKEKLDIVYLEDVIEKFKILLLVKTDNEEQWQNFFEKYSWMLTHLFPYQVILKKGKAYVGGKTIENAEGRVVDFLFKNNLSDNFALLEIKTHNKELMKPTAYRKPDVFALADELSGGINQCLDQKDVFLRDFGKENPAYDPKSILVIGQKRVLDKHQSKCFELLRSNQKNVDIVTFDELLSKLEGLHMVITGKLK
jgi:hypothetical protein